MNATDVTANRDARRERHVTTLVSGAETGRRLAIVELREAVGQEPPRHLHTNEDETLYVREGTVTVFVGDRAIPAGPGACLFLPRGVEHGYAIESRVARLVVVCTPAGIEGYYQELAALGGDVSVEQSIALSARYGIAITGPAPARGRNAHSIDGRSRSR